MLGSGYDASALQACIEKVYLRSNLAIEQGSLQKLKILGFVIRLVL